MMSAGEAPQVLHPASSDDGTLAIPQPSWAGQPHAEQNRPSSEEGILLRQNTHSCPTICRITLTPFNESVQRRWHRAPRALGRHVFTFHRDWCCPLVPEPRAGPPRLSHADAKPSAGHPIPDTDGSSRHRRMTASAGQRSGCGLICRFPETGVCDSSCRTQPASQRGQLQLRPWLIGFRPTY
jgi:hypothetical protein